MSCVWMINKQESADSDLYLIKNAQFRGLVTGSQFVQNQYCQTLMTLKFRGSGYLLF